MRKLARLASGAAALALVAAFTSCGQQSPQKPQDRAQQPEPQQAQPQQAQKQPEPQQAQPQQAQKQPEPQPAQPQQAQKQPEPQQAQPQQAQKQPEPQQAQTQPAQKQPANENSNQKGAQSTAENPSEGEIRLIQQALEQKGFKVGYVDGKLGPMTKRALSQFQRKQGLQQTGMPDQQTLAALGVAGGASTAGQGPSGSQAPVGHRQPTAADAPSQDPYDEQLRHDLNICQRC